MFWGMNHSQCLEESVRRRSIRIGRCALIRVAPRLRCWHHRHGAQCCQVGIVDARNAVSASVGLMSRFSGAGLGAKSVLGGSF